jgi:L-malate glycosyltransferase
MSNKQSAIIHISYDLNEDNTTSKTTAVSNLVKQTGKFAENVLISLNRSNKKNQEYTKLIKENFLVINSFGYPYGIFHKRHLENSYKKINNAVKDGLVNFSNAAVVHAHKVTFDGYVGYLVSRQLSLPLFLTLRQTDFAIFRYRPDLKIFYKKIISYSRKIFYLVPIMISLLKKAFGEEYFQSDIESKLVYLPNIIDNFPETTFIDPGEKAPLVTILRISKKSVKRKNVRNLFKAVAKLKDLDLKLEIIGGGDYTPVLRKWVNDYQIDDKIVFKGTIPNENINEYYAKAKAFIMPSFSESFGLVYAESLLNGTPILYSKGVVGFDGVLRMSAAVSILIR